MTPPDDIPGEAAANQSARPGSGPDRVRLAQRSPAQQSSARLPRAVGPESEDRGGPEAPADSLDDKRP